MRSDSGLVKACSGGGPVERDVCVRDGPLRELRFVHVRGESLHDLAMRDLANEIVERLLIFPYGKRPELAGEGLCVERIADEARGSFQLALNLKSETEEIRNSAEMAKRKVGDERKILAPGRGRRNANPRSGRHG